jgi:pimeloyl-ACP methyl ester carboxylesterase
MPEIQLEQGTIHYRETGSGAPVVLIHGLLVNGQVWDGVVSRLPADVRCIVPDLPLGSHATAMSPGADVTPMGVSGMIAELIEKLDLREVTLVGNDTGGALCQLVCAHHSDRIGTLVLTNCDAFENFPPPALRLVMRFLARMPGAVAELAQLGRLRPVRNAAMKLAPLTVEPIPDGLLKSWLAPLRDRRVRKDLVSFLRGISPHRTLEAAERLRGFDRPVLIVWGMRDRFFPIADAERLIAILPKGRLERIENARTFVQLDAPARLAELVADFARPAEMAAVET